MMTAATVTNHNAILGSLDTNGIVAYSSDVMHQRLRPFTYQFNYQIISVCLDIDQFHADNKNLSWLGNNRFKLMSIYTRDFGSRDGQPWRKWLSELLAEYGINEKPTTVILACTPRCLGVGFNPLAMWYAYNDAGELIAVIAEVSNTFGQFHHYVLSHGGEVIPIGKTLKIDAPKDFHVSPFLAMNCHYYFTLKIPNLQEHTPYQVSIRETEDDQNTLLAVQTSQPITLPSNASSIKRMGYWLSSIKTLTAIHWWALKIIIKGGKFRRTPKHLRQKTYGHSALSLSHTE